MIIALTGEKLSGKDTVASYMVEKHGAHHVRHSHILDEILTILGVPISRRNEIDLGMGLRQIFGNGILGRALHKRVTNSEASLIVINGMRFQDELQNAHELGAVIAYITAPESVRYERFLKRQEKVDDATMSMDQFRLQEQEPTEIGIPSLGAQADLHIDNTGTLEELYEKVDIMLEESKKMQANPDGLE